MRTGGDASLPATQKSTIEATKSHPHVGGIATSSREANDLTMTRWQCMARNLGFSVGLMTAIAASAAMPNVSLRRLDCGRFVTKQLTDSCYLVEHNGTYLLWDAGLGTELIGRPQGQGTRGWIELNTTLADQLKRIGLVPHDIAILALSHTHFDHIGQAPEFSNARLLIGRQDWDALVSAPASDERRVRLESWIEGISSKKLITGDHDVYGDGSVVMIATPGHTPGHHSLLVRLHTMGPVLLTGDLYNSAQQFAENSVPPNNSDPAATVSSFVHFRKLAHDLNATVIIQHEPADISKLPAFPQAAQ